ncbi:type I 3-dehydroquinate dehydratase [Actinocrispum wychmicini]|uniref:3-dehydroquinate dehydratase n=1 Tax=Actinocrispum wychmicini TaxID=1213861 RepID=A0A4R2IUP0_9PSEU|nr:type I 3-dehydroquinate dehydratase [Actinocrispum wychmicini]TCO46635.1 3-dehydroquinate dehydratase [Actinocrispum wychmicini]
MTTALSRPTCTVMATLLAAPWRVADELRVLGRAGGGLEVRADVIGDIDPSTLREYVRGDLVYSLRSTAAGGVFVGGNDQRRRRILNALRRYDLVELEDGRDTSPEMLAAVPPHRRVISWHGRGVDLPALVARFTRMAAAPARHYLLVPHALTAQHAMAPLRLLRLLNRSNVTAFSTGETGVCGRILGPWLGAPMVFGQIGGTSDEVPSVERLLRDYPFPTLPKVDRLYGIIGRSITGSLSPRMHNDAYRVLDHPALFLPITAREFLPAWEAIVTGLGLPFGGATVVAPFKEAALRMADVTTGPAAMAGAANVLVRTENGWRAHTTDPIGVVGALGRAGVKLTGRKAAIVGCGGAGRGAAAGLKRFGVTTVLVNRTVDRGIRAARMLGLDFVPLDRFVPADYSLIVHATPVKDDLLFPVGNLAGDTTVVDLTYGRRPTALVTAARRRHLQVVDGWEVLRIEVARQFRLMTGRSMPHAHSLEHVT